MDFDKTCFSVFKTRTIDPIDLLAYRKRLAAYRSYLVAMTPRSGSSLLADLLGSIKTAGRPAEFFAHRQMANTLAALTRREVHVESLMEYMNWILDARTTSNNVLGVKASFYQYQPIIATGLEAALLGTPMLIYLTRNNIVLQAVSMYIAAQTRLFHSTQSASAAARDRSEVAYSAKDIRDWVAHIHAQEQGWERYLASVGRNALRLGYDELRTDTTGCLERILDHLGVAPKLALRVEESGHKKIGGDLNARFFDKFVSEQTNRRFLSDRGIPDGRLTGA